MERSSEGVGAFNDLANGEGNDDERNGSHEAAEADIAGGFNTRLASREFTRVYSIDGFIAQQQGQVGHGVEDGVRHGGEQRQRSRGYGTVDLHTTKDDVCSKTGVHGDLVLETVLAVQLAGGTHMLFNRFQHALDVLILVLVEALELARDKRLLAPRARLLYQLHDPSAVGVGITLP